MDGKKRDEKEMEDSLIIYFPAIKRPFCAPKCVGRPRIYLQYELDS